MNAGSAYTVSDVSGNWVVGITAPLTSNSFSYDLDVSNPSEAKSGLIDIKLIRVDTSNCTLMQNPFVALSFNPQAFTISDFSLFLNSDETFTVVFTTQTTNLASYIEIDCGDEVRFKDKLGSNETVTASLYKRTVDLTSPGSISFTSTALMKQFCYSEIALSCNLKLFI